MAPISRKRIGGVTNWGADARRRPLNERLVASDVSGGAVLLR